VLEAAKQSARICLEFSFEAYMTCGSRSCRDEGAHSVHTVGPTMDGTGKFVWRFENIHLRDREKRWGRGHHANIERRDRDNTLRLHAAQFRVPTFYDRRYEPRV
jgi:hypothetical protein